MTFDAMVNQVTAGAKPPWDIHASRAKAKAIAKEQTHTTKGWAPLAQRAPLQAP